MKASEKTLYISLGVALDELELYALKLEDDKKIRYLCDEIEKLRQKLFNV